MSSDAGHTIPTPCDSPADPIGYHGEMEDYSIEIGYNSSVETPAALANILSVFPNPFSGGTHISFELEEPSLTSLEIYNVMGEKVHTLMNNISQAKGTQNYYLEWEAPAGIYIIRLQTNRGIYSQQLIKNH